MNEIVNNFILVGDKRMSEKHLRQLGLHNMFVDHLQET